jgi:glycosyltransferase involved in cell wall biosynthesis
VGAVEAPLSQSGQIAEEAALESVLSPISAADQPPLLALPAVPLHAAIASLALGGAERIVLEWAARCAHRYRVRLIVLREARREWTPPVGVDIVRLRGEHILTALQALGEEIARSGNPLVLCHLLLAGERRALERAGVETVPVLHNARAGWIEPADAVSRAARVATVSRSAAAELAGSGVRAPVTVLRYLPPVPRHCPAMRRRWRTRWAIPRDAVVLGMIGGVKPQKAYPRALRVLAALLERCPAYLVIVGGPTGRDGVLAWQAVLAQAQRLGVVPFVRLPGDIENAAQCLPAFDVLLNTSRYEGLSIATLEALAAGMPVVASLVGGQGEVGAPGLALVPFNAPDALWAEALANVIGLRPEKPDWLGFPASRAWTLCHLAPSFVPQHGVLFVTANLNAGGAQRSLVNLALELRRRIRFEIAVCGNSSTAAFSDALRKAGVAHFRASASRDCFDHAEALVRRVVQTRPSAICFWNADPKVKLLVAKTLGHTRLGFFDVSPGAYAFEELHATRRFQEWIAFTEDEFYARLDRLVLKYHASLPEGVRARTAVIHNGARAPARAAERCAGRPRRVVVSGRIAPSKFLLEILGAMRLVWAECPDAELHLMGPAEERHLEYAKEVLRVSRHEQGRRVFFHGAVFDAPEHLAEYDVALVLGEHQGCPNAVLEAMAAGVAVVANDSGGTRELIVDGRSGLLLPDREPLTIARSLLRVLADDALARRLSRSARRRVAVRFTMERMASAYLKLFKSA